MHWSTAEWYRCMGSAFHVRYDQVSGASLQVNEFGYVGNFGLCSLFRWQLLHWKQNLERAHALFSWLLEAKLPVNLAKWEFDKATVFLFVLVLFLWLAEPASLLICGWVISPETHYVVPIKSPTFDMRRELDYPDLPAWCFDYFIYCIHF